MQTAVFFIRTPFEMICAVNAIKQYKLVEYDFYLLQDDLGRFEQVKNIADYFNVKYVVKPLEYLVSGSLKKGIFNYLFKNCSKYNIVYTGDYRRPSEDLFSLSYIKPGGRLIKVDDGSCTIGLLRNSLVISRGLRRMMNLIRFLCSIKRISITYLTVFDKIENKMLNIEYNNISLLGKDVGGPSTLCLYMLGTNPKSYINNVNISIEEYWNLLEKTLRLLSNKGKQVFFIPHGFDNDHKTKQLCYELNITYLKLNECVESYILRNSIKPDSVYGFTSTALFSLMKIFPDIEVYDVVPDNGANTDNLFREISEYYQLNGIKTIKIKL